MAIVGDGLRSVGLYSGLGRWPHNKQRMATPAVVANIVQITDGWDNF